MTLRIILILAMLAGAASVVQASTSWEEYLESPTAANAARVVTPTYSTTEGQYDRLVEDLQLLEVQVLSRDVEAIRLAFRLRAKADGHLGETIDVMLGRLIRV